MTHVAHHANWLVKWQVGCMERTPDQCPELVGSYAPAAAGGALGARVVQGARGEVAVRWLGVSLAASQHAAFLAQGGVQIS